MGHLRSTTNSAQPHNREVGRAAVVAIGAYDEMLNKERGRVIKPNKEPAKVLGHGDGQLNVEDGMRPATRDVNDFASLLNKFDRRMVRP